jgi:adenylosuccinate lyase
MIPRYQRPIMKTLWSDDHKFNQYLKVELASSFAWMKLDLFDEKTYQALSQATFNLQDIYDIELETKHDVIAFTRAISKSLGDEKEVFSLWINLNGCRRYCTIFNLKRSESNTFRRY